jgi:hypothetical protein
MHRDKKKLNQQIIKLLSEQKSAGSFLGSYRNKVTLVATD